jgi:hypothetical protein
MLTSSMLGKKKCRPRKRLVGWFAKGSISGEWISRAAQLPGQSLHIALAIQYSRGVFRERRTADNLLQLYPLPICPNRTVQTDLNPASASDAQKHIRS